MILQNQVQGTAFPAMCVRQTRLILPSLAGIGDEGARMITGALGKCTLSHLNLLGNRLRSVLLYSYCP